MPETALKIDRAVRKFLIAFCIVALFGMVVFTLYTVFMRYAFLDPPLWGDTLTMFCNIWLVFIALALMVREKDHVALDYLYTRLPPTFGFVVQLWWTVIIFLIGLVICWQGWLVAIGNPNKLWEFGYMPKTYPLMIMPLSGFLMSIAALVAIIEDTILFRAGKFKIGRDFAE